MDRINSPLEQEDRKWSVRLLFPTGTVLMCECFAPTWEQCERLLEEALRDEGVWVEGIRVAALAT